MRFYRSPLALVIGTAVVSGFSVYLNDLFVAKIDPSLFAFLKNTVVALLLGAILLASSHRREIAKLRKSQWLKIALIGLIGGSLPFLLFFWGLSMTSGPLGAFLHKSMFIPIAILAALFLRERPNLPWLIGAFLLLIGNAFFLRVGLATFTLAHWLILAAVVLWSIENILAKRAMEEMSGTIVAFGRMGFGALFILLFLGGSGELMKIGTVLTPSNGLAILVSALMLLLYVLTWYNGIAGMRISDAACILLLASPITLLLSTLAQHKPVTTPQILGALLLVEGLFVILYSLERRVRYTLPAKR
jgi:drug/metabolite transporter (DMT)-like permease